MIYKAGKIHNKREQFIKDYMSKGEKSMSSNECDMALNLDTCNLYEYVKILEKKIYELEKLVSNGTSMPVGDEHKLM